MFNRRIGKNSSVVLTLIGINVAVFILQQINWNFFIEYFSLVPVYVTKRFYVWQIFTHMFLHGNFLHLFFNMFSLFLFGISLEQIWGPKKFIAYYIVSGLGGGILQYLLNINSNIPSIGASGAVYGILLAFGMTFPETILYLNFFFPVKAKYAVIIFGVMEFFFGVTGTASGIAHFAHLGGLISGFIYLKLESRFHGIKSSLKTTKVYRNFEEADNSKKRDRINELLDKISSSGYDNLSEKEKYELDDLSKWFRDNG